MSEAIPENGLATWAVVEVMGHSTYAGYVTEQTVASQSFVRIDVPAVDERAAFTKLLGAGSIFSITPCEEQIARAMVEARRTCAPVELLALPSRMKEQLRLGQQVMERASQPPAFSAPIDAMPEDHNSDDDATHFDDDAGYPWNGDDDDA